MNTAVASKPDSEAVPARSMSDRVMALEKSLLDVTQVDCPMRHHFTPGVYAREINIPAGTALIGVEHKVDNLVIVSMGKLLVMTEKGAIEVCAGDVFTCKAGTKNAAVALENTRWTNIFPNPDDNTDTAALVERFTFVKESDLLGGSTNKQLAANKAAISGEASCHLEQ